MKNLEVAALTILTYYLLILERPYFSHLREVSRALSSFPFLQCVSLWAENK